jgi:hypothetical protein
VQFLRNQARYAHCGHEKNQIIELKICKLLFVAVVDGLSLRLVENAHSLRLRYETRQTVVGGLGDWRALMQLAWPNVESSEALPFL